jgi:hypothetical protein
MMDVSLGRLARGAQRAFLGMFFVALVLKVATAGSGGRSASLVAALLMAAGCLTAAWLLSRGREALWIDGWRLLLVLPVLWAVPHVYERVGGDGFEYYAIAHSVVFDQDLRFDNEYAGLGTQPVAGENGEATSRFPFGVALLWIPSLVVCRLVASAASWAGIAADTSGFGAGYQTAANATTFVLAVAGLALLERHLRRSFSKPLAAWTVLALWLATPLSFYSIANPSMSHGAAFFAATVFLLAWLAARETPTDSRWIMVGLAGGLMSLVRIQDGVLMALPALDEVARRRSVRPLLLLGAGPLAAAVLQLSIWYRMLGSDLFSLADTLGGFHHAALHLGGVLFSARHGLFTWTPVLILAVCGWVLRMRRDRWLMTLFWLGLVLNAALNSYRNDWWGGDAFGQRRLLSLLPFFALGLAEALRFLETRPLVPVSALLLALVVWNQQFAAIYNRRALAGRGDAISLDRLAGAEVREPARSVVRWYREMPRPLWVFLYDNLMGIWLDEGSSSLDGLVDLGRKASDVPLAGHGWSPPLSEDGSRFRFSNGPRSWITVPILTPADFDVTIRIRAAFDAAPVVVRLEAGGEVFGEARLTPEWSERTFLLPGRLLQPGMNDLALSYSVTPASVIPGFRGRNAAVAASWIRFARRPPG